MVGVAVPPGSNDEVHLTLLTDAIFHCDISLFFDNLRII